jgi:hypothetical protein
MQKKHQIFVSSTFSDLKPERQAAVESILAAGHIPAGMELFAAGDESQMDVIKRWIDDSDIYMLILGGRYGSINPTSGLSYTGHEYDYALHKGKSFFALVLTDIAIEKKRNELGASHKEIDNIEKYANFRDKVLSKISKSVDDCKDVKLGVLESIRLLEKKTSLQGWVRSDEFPDMAPLIDQLSILTKENAQLKKTLTEMPVSTLNDGKIQLADLDDKISVSIEYKTDFRESSKQNQRITLTWSELFGLIAPKLLSGQADSTVKGYLPEQLLENNGTAYDSCKIKEQDFQSIKTHLMALNLVDVEYSNTVQGGAALFWNLTPIGKRTMLELRAAKKPNNSNVGKT